MTARQDRLADARANTAGVREAHYARETGTLVLVVNADEQGLDADGGETAWYTICDDHHQCVGHASLTMARSHASNPLGWCEVCNGSDVMDEDDTAW